MEFDRMEFDRLVHIYRLWAEPDTQDLWTLRVVASLVASKRLDFPDVAEKIVRGWRAKDGLAALQDGNFELIRQH